jgi:hypothetical protein
VSDQTSWFHTITRPVSRLVATAVALAAFVAGIVLGALIPERGIWFQLPAVIILMGWYLVMSRLYVRAKRARGTTSH